MKTLLLTTLILLFSVLSFAQDGRSTEYPFGLNWEEKDRTWMSIQNSSEERVPASIENLSLYEKVKGRLYPGGKDEEPLRVKEGLADGKALESNAIGGY